MAQFYFLSVLLNIIAGLVLVYGFDLTKKNNTEKQPSASFFGNLTCFENRTFRLVVGVLSMLVGLMKILSVFRNDVPVIGDLVPALAGLTGGASLLLEYYLSATTEEVRIPEGVTRVLIGGRKYIGVFCLVAGLLHFIFPQVVLL